MASWFAIPSRAAAEDIRTTEPPVPVIARTAARTVRNAEVRLAASTPAHSSSVVRWAGFSTSEPTQLTTPSMPP